MMFYKQTENENGTSKEDISFSGSTLEGTNKITDNSWSTVTAGFKPGPICVGFEVHMAVLMESTVFWHIMSCAPSEINRLLRRTTADFTLVLYLTHSTLKMEVICSSEKLVDS
jgi:hypothetical protein